MSRKHNFKGIFTLSALLICMLCLVAFTVGCKDTPNNEEGTTSPTQETTLRELESTVESTSVTESKSESQSQPTETEEETTDYFEANKIETVKPDTQKTVDASVEGEGYDIYQLPESQDWGYRYGCTMLYGDDGNVDAYFACVGTDGQWDWISYRHSDDDGKTWSNEKIVLTPTKGTTDALSCCDPGVVYFNGYYYLGYTSTLNVDGTCNNLHVARSKNPDGPFEKWNGNGWGGDKVEPIVRFEYNYSDWGIGEPSFIELNGTLYIYFTQQYSSQNYLMVATADARNENWPSTLEVKGVGAEVSTDSLDIKYIEEWGKFVGVATGNRMGSSSYLAIYESNDGLIFNLCDAVREGTYPALHNAGLSSRRNGHIKMKEDEERLRVIYAYGTGWGQWNTRVQNINLVLTDSNDIEAEKQKACLDKDAVRAPMLPKEERFITLLRAENDSYVYSEKARINLKVYTYDTYFNKVNVAAKEGIEYIVENEDVISIKRGKVTINGVGKTKVTVRYEGFENHFYMTIVKAEDFNLDADPHVAVKFEPTREEYKIAFSEKNRVFPQIRGRLYVEDGTFVEIYTNSDKSLTSLSRIIYNAAYTGYDDSVISVSDTGIITAKSCGVTEVTVTSGGLSFKVKVTVADDDKLRAFPPAGKIDVPEKKIDYTNLDFAQDDLSKILNVNACSHIFKEGEGTLFTVTSTNSDPAFTDAFFAIKFTGSDDLIMAEDYKYLDITYMVPDTVSNSATNMQVFFCCGEVSAPDAAYQVMKATEKDGQYHTLRIDLSELAFCKGKINLIRIDFFDASLKGDSMYIKSVKLVTE